MAPPRKLLVEYEREAVRQPNGCLIHLSQGAARKTYIMRHGPLLSAQYVCHKCDNPKCIEDKHHFLGTCRDNVLDAVAKKRHSCFAPPNGRGMVGPHSEDTRRRISATMKRVWEQRRANT